jgi:TRAP-type C4-dicarboxylate transport system permease large subunit
MTSKAGAMSCRPQGRHLGAVPAGIIIFGLKFGIFTPTEAAVVAAVYSLFVAIVIYRELKVGQVFDVLVAATKSTGIVMFLVAAALAAAWLITIADLPGQMVELLQPLMGNQTC